MQVSVSHILHPTQVDMSNRTVRYIIEMVSVMSYISWMTFWDHGFLGQGPRFCQHLEAVQSLASGEMDVGAAMMKHWLKARLRSRRRLEVLEDPTE